MSLVLVLVICFLPLCLCYTSFPKTSFFVNFYWLIKLTIGIWWRPLPRMLVMCLSNLSWWQYFLYIYIKKEYCGLLGGLTFYRTRHICKSEKKKTKTYKNEHLPFLAQGMYTKMYKNDPFCGLCTLPFSYITSFWYMLWETFSSWFPLEVVCIKWIYLLHGRKQGNNGLELHDVGYVY